MDCRNCGYKIDGDYCAACGQKVAVDRLNWKNFIREFTEGVFHVDKGLWYTLIQLTKRPGKSIQDFLDGKRKPHFKPIAYVLTLSTIFFLFIQFTGGTTWFDDMLTGFISGMEESNTEREVPSFLKWMAKNYAYATLLSIPLFSLMSYLSFLKSGKYYLEHIVINSYITGHQAIIYLIFGVIMHFYGSSDIEYISLIVSMMYAYWVYLQVFDQSHWVITILWTTLTYVLYFVIGVLLILVIITAPEIVNSIQEK